ncbi:MAG: arginine repressor [Bacteroidales bacterium]
MKAQRQAAILALVDREPFKNQQMLQRSLRALGFKATQATLSRDIKELGLVKRASDGAYQRAHQDPGNPEAAAASFERLVAQFLMRVDRVEQLVVVRTGPGQAQPLALALDRAGLPEVAGTIAGDDTVLVVVRTSKLAEALVKRLEHLISG